MSEKSPLLERATQSVHKSFWIIIVTIIIIMMLVTIGLPYMWDSGWAWFVAITIDLACLGGAGLFAYRHGGWVIIDSMKAT